jgi:predicted transcriptional regulator
MSNYKHSVKEVAESYNYSQSTIRQRALKLGIKPSIIKKNKVYELTQGEVYDIINFNEKNINIPEVIYVHTIWEVRESKLNFM